MSINEIKKVLNNLIINYLDKKIDRKNVVIQLITKLDIDEIYSLDEEPFITDCYFAIKHLTENGYETTSKELQYFKECFMESRVYDIDEKNEFILNKEK
jgi:hypothetical protein